MLLPFPSGRPSWPDLLAVALALTLTVSPFGFAQDPKEAEVKQLVADYRRAEQLRADGKNAEAARLYEVLTTTAKRLFGPDSVNTADLLNNRGLVLEALGRYEEAAQRYRECVHIAEEHFPDDPRLPRFQTNLGEAYRLTGQLGKAEPTLRDALARRQKLGAGHEAEVAESLNSLAVLCQEKGDLAEAEQHFTRCLQLREEVLGPSSPAVADTCDLMGQLYGQLGQDRRALELYQRGLTIRQKRFGPDHLATAASLNDLAVHHLNHQRFAEAEQPFRQALEIFESHYGTEHPDTAKAYHNLAWTCLNLNKTAEAERLQARAVRVWKAKLRPDHPLLALGLSNQGVLEFVAGRLESAENLQRQALEIRRRSLGPDHPNVASSLERLGRVLAAEERWDEAAEAFDQGRRVLRRHTSRVLPALSEAEQLAFLQDQDTASLHAALSLALQRPDDEKIVELSAGWVLNGKAVSQEVLAAEVLLARDSSDRDTRQTLTQLRSIQSQMAALAVAGSDPEKSQRQTLESQERELVKRLGRTTGHSLAADPWVELDRVRAALADDALLVEIACFRVWDVQAHTAEPTWGLDHYAAWLIPPRGRGRVRLVDLGPAREVERAVQAVCQTLQAAPSTPTHQGTLQQLGEQEAEQQVRQPLEALARLVFWPLQEQAGKTERWIISADASLWLVPWAALPLRDGSYAVEKYPFRYLVSGRDVVNTQGAGATGIPLILADPDYDLGPDEARASARELVPGRDGGDVVRAVKSIQGIPRVRRLPYSAAEAREVAPSLERYTGSKPTLRLGETALEGVFKAARQPRVVMLSTHGFFLANRNIASEGAAEVGQPLVNPLLRCGLLLAGCNQRDKLRKGDEDGVLTGLEVVGTDLRGTELVVLSACETGLGEVRNGEGVSGLRQAFQLAGARAVVATLWDIQDRESALLMKEFFGNLADGKSREDALREAQLSRIMVHRRRNGAAHPFYWAAFTLTGP